jgi:hypothetical protein
MFGRMQQVGSGTAGVERQWRHWDSRGSETANTVGERGCGTAEQWNGRSVRQQDGRTGGELAGLRDSETGGQWNNWALGQLGVEQRTVGQWDSGTVGQWGSGVVG